jgi:hypothetical protein
LGQEGDGTAFIGKTQHGQIFFGRVTAKIALTNQTFHEIWHGLVQLNNDVFITTLGRPLGYTIDVVTPREPMKVIVETFNSFWGVKVKK